MQPLDHTAWSALGQTVTEAILHDIWLAAGTIATATFGLVIRRFRQDHSDVEPLHLEQPVLPTPTDSMVGNDLVNAVEFPSFVMIRGSSEAQYFKDLSDAFHSEQKLSKAYAFVNMQHGLRLVASAGVLADHWKLVMDRLAEFHFIFLPPSGTTDKEKANFAAHFAFTESVSYVDRPHALPKEWKMQNFVVMTNPDRAFAYTRDENAVFGNYVVYRSKPMIDHLWDRFNAIKIQSELFEMRRPAKSVVENAIQAKRSH